MRRELEAVLSFLIAVGCAMLLVAVPAASADDTEEPVDPAPAEITVYGYVSDISNEDGNVPLEGVTVSVVQVVYSSTSTSLDATLYGVDTCVTDDDGMFELTYPNDGGTYYLTFELQGYTVRTLPNNIASVEGYEGLYSFSIVGITPDEDGRYRLCENGYSESPVGMAFTYGTITVTVTGDEGSYPVEGATVTLVSSTGDRTTQETDADGEAVFDVPYGDYTVQVSRSGFQDSAEVSADTYENNQVAIDLVANEFGIDFLGGLDMPHAMMVLGLVLIGLFLLACAILYRRYKKGDGGQFEIVNDLETLEDEEKKERP